jgi:hypothetical protein
MARGATAREAVEIAMRFDTSCGLGIDEYALVAPKPGEIVADANAVAAYQLGHANGFQLGMAQGELRGRQELAHELEMQYGIDAREDLDPDAVRRIRSRQVH